MIRFGVAGFPPSFEKTPDKRDRVSILHWLHGLGLDALELQMTYGPRTLPETCRRYGALAKELGISLSVHASYFIVFTSQDRIKIQQSTDTLKRTYDLCDELEAKVIVLHPGSLYGETEYDARQRFVENIGNFFDGFGKSSVGLFVETAGKVGQLGSVDDILEISKSVPGVFPCIDFGHVHARTLGTLDNEAAIVNLTDKLKHFCVQQPASRIHFHYTPIHYGNKGEISHRAITDIVPASIQPTLFAARDSFNEKDNLFHPRYERVAASLKDFPIDCTVISETMNSQEVGALALKRSYYGTQ